MENRCGNSLVILKVPTRKEKESATITLTMGGNGRRTWGGKKKVLLTSLGAEARFSLSALAVGILESCSQILQSPSWATPWLQVTASVMARRRWAAAPSTRSTFNGAARQWPTFLAAPSPPSPGAQVYAGGTPASSGRPRGLAAQLRTSKPAWIFLLLKKKIPTISQGSNQ